MVRMSANIDPQPSLKPSAAATTRALPHYLALARPDHWAKNVLMVPGIAVALFYRPERFGLDSAWAVLLTLVATCLVASSNYVLNEVLDAKTDSVHPYKSSRPAAAGHISTPLALAEWIALGAVGIALALLVNLPVGMTAIALWVMGVLYNVPPVRLKDWPYVDVLSESANNALRLALGWFPVVPDRYPPFSLVLAYWMAGAFLMALKRFSDTASSTSTAWRVPTAGRSPDTPSRHCSSAASSTPCWAPSSAGCSSCGTASSLS